jgi:hypothetical protein
MIRKILIGISIIAGISIICFVAWLIIVIAAFGGFDKDYSVTDLINNFEDKKLEIYEAKRYYAEIVPPNKFIEIEFENNNTIARLGIQLLNRTDTEIEFENKNTEVQLGTQVVSSNTNNNHKSIFLEWNLKINDLRTDSIIQTIGWSRETLKELKDKLDNANCIGIHNGEPFKISFKRSGMGMYSFNVFDKPIPETKREYYNDSCTYILVNDKLVLEYGGGAVGSQCFYKLE